MTAHVKYLLVLILAVCLLLSAGQAIQVARASSSAGTPGIGWFVLGAGGGPSGGGNVALNATLGQPVVGTSSAGNIVLRAGYWSATPVSGTKIYLPLLRK